MNTLIEDLLAFETVPDIIRTDEDSDRVVVFSNKWLATRTFEAAAEDSFPDIDEAVRWTAVEVMACALYYQRDMAAAATYLEQTHPTMPRTLIDRLLEVAAEEGPTLFDGNETYTLDRFDDEGIIYKQTTQGGSEWQ